MRSRLENWLLSRWYGERRPPLALRALEKLYRSVFNHRKSKAQKRGAYRSRAPLVIVGNITAGGTGKTPLVIKLCQVATELGLNPGIVSTGYGRQGRGQVSVRADSDPCLHGDEPVLMAQRTGFPVIVSDDRTDAAKAMDELGVDIILSDDGLQQPGLKADIEICVVDGSRGVGNGHQIPAGPLREPVERLFEFDYVVSNGDWKGRPGKLEVTKMELAAESVFALDGGHSLSLEQFYEKYAAADIVAVAGIGNPDRFFHMLKSHGLNVRTQTFPDHHAFSRQDFSSMQGAKAIIMTEKDAVKCRMLGLDNAWYVPVDCSLADSFINRLKNHMKKLVDKSE